jgi:hypothetical protein
MLRLTKQIKRRVGLIADVLKEHGIEDYEVVPSKNGHFRVRFERTDGEKRSLTVTCSTSDNQRSDPNMITQLRRKLR